MVLKETTDKSDHAKSIVVDAKDAAAKAFAAGMKAPWPLNMVIAPVLAAAAFTGTMAFAEKGALVPDDMLMNVHKDEMALRQRLRLLFRVLLLVVPSAGTAGLTSTAHQ